MKNAYSARGLFVAAILFCLSALSATAQTITQNHITYKIVNATDGASATASGTDGTYLSTIVIADSVKDSNGKYFPVTAIYPNAFKGNRNINRVVFGSNLKKIGSYAFSGCEALMEIHVPEGVETIENYAFQNCSMRYADLPSTLRTLGSGVFKSNAVQELDTLVLRTAYYDAAGQMNILPFNTSCFNSRTRLKDCVLMVPKKAYDYYAAPTTASGASNWGYFFENNIISFGTAPSGCTVVPQEGLKDFRDLTNVEVTFNFDDEKLQNVLSFGPNDYINASLVLPNGKSLSADNVEFKGNSICLDFAEVLQKNRQLFIAPSEDESSLKVQLKLDGQILLEECPFMLGSFFVHHPISWDVPLLPSVYELPKAPTVEPQNLMQDGHYHYKAFENITLKFDGYSGLSLDSSTGAYISARLYKDSQELALSQRAEVTGDNTLTIPFSIPVDQLLVRQASGIDSYNFSLEVEGQVIMSEGNEEKNFHFNLPLGSTAATAAWKVLPVYIPEPTGVSFLPEQRNVNLHDLTDVAVNFEGVSQVSVSSRTDAQPLKAQLFMEGGEVVRLESGKVRAVGNTLHLLFDPIDERLVTLITSNDSCSYKFTMRLEADLITDGYPCRVVIGEEPNSGTAADGTDGTYTLRWASPQWNVAANICDIPEVTVNVPAAENTEVEDYEQLQIVELCIDNYESVEPLPMSSGAFAVGRLVRYGNPVCVVNSVTTEGNKIIIDFSQKLTYNVVGITPDDDPEQPVDLTLYFEGDLLFDGIPYHLVYDGYKEDLSWSLKPVVVRKLPAPTVERDKNRIFFTSGVEGVEYHYTITNADMAKETSKEATKTNGGGSLRIPLQRRYLVSVYTSREGYEDSEVTNVHLLLDTTPIIDVKK